MGCPQTRRKISKSILRRFNTAKQPTEPAGTVRVNPFKADKDTTLRPATQVKPQASVGMNAVVGKNVFIGAKAVIGSGVMLGNDVRVQPGAEIGDCEVIPDGATVN